MTSVEGFVQHYAWGDHEFIPRMLGLDPDGRPWAELWLGTHPHGPARIADGRPLADVVGELPYMLKVLAAAKPLSLQTHPSAEQAIDGFAHKGYVDDRPKPELLMALTEFEAFCGIRPTSETVTLLRALGIDELATVVEQVGPAAAMAGLYRGELAAHEVIERCAISQRPEARWVTALHRCYPNDPSVAVTILLNLVSLQPGQAVRLDAGNLHAYLRGAGIELMGASDNVVRGGLTDKDVNIDELLFVVDPTPLIEPIIDCAADRYELPAAGVALRRVEPGVEHVATGDELSIDTNGQSWLHRAGDRLVPTVPTYVVVTI